MRGDARPVILGYDAVSPLGTVLDEQWQVAADCGSGVGPLTRFPLREQFPVTIAGQVPSVDVGPYPFLRPREMAQWTSPVFLHGMLVVHRALERIGLSITPELAPRVGVTFSTAIGGLDAVLEADRQLSQQGRLPKPFVNPNSCINMVGGKISILTGAQGPISTTITACATGSTSMITGALFLQAGMADVVICGAVDFPLVEPIVAGFATMNGAYKHKPDDGDTPSRASRPFAQDRRGFVVSEGAACIVLATREFADVHGLSYRFELAGWDTTADAFHFVAPNPVTVSRCVRGAIAHAGIAPSDVDSVNAHAASTRVGDKIEADILHEVFGSAIPPVVANKSQLGHLMGASSAMESVLALEGMRRQVLLPTINHSPDPELPGLPLSLSCQCLEQEFVLKNAFGFGGCNACLVFRRV
ncbi:MAG: beta-ketoacyl-[acyl-carrier-protein] synthase family protein [Deltaproteobacteria bacterium]|nr:beta-ketoacyl-[acyl-carrier-protein] synthase family protein [Deltaproteobacteria bacterium]